MRVAATGLVADMVLTEYISGHGLVLLGGHGLVLLFRDCLQISVRLLVFGCDGELMLVLGFLACFCRHTEDLPGRLLGRQFWFLVEATDLWLLF